MVLNSNGSVRVSTLKASTKTNIVQGNKPKDTIYIEAMTDWNIIFRDFKGKWVAIADKNTVVTSGRIPLETNKTGDMVRSFVVD